MLRSHHLALALMLASPLTAAAQTAPALPSAETQALLIKNTLAALNHASITGNYTVLRDLSSDGFRQRFKADQLSQLFGHLRQQKVNLSPVLVCDVHLSQTPTLSSTGRLRLIGLCPMRPRAIQFDLAFQYGPQGWAIDEIGVALQQQVVPVAAATSVAPTVTPRQAGSGYAVKQAAVQQPAATRAPARRLPAVR